MNEPMRYVFAILFIVWVLAMFLILNRILPQAVDSFLRVFP